MSIAEQVDRARGFAGLWGSEAPPHKIYESLRDWDDSDMVPARPLVGDNIVVVEDPGQFPELFRALPGEANRMREHTDVIQRRANDHHRAAEGLGVGVQHHVRLYTLADHTEATEIRIQDIRPRLLNDTSKLGLAAVISTPELEPPPMSLSFITDMNDLNDLGYEGIGDVVFRVERHNMAQSPGGLLIPMPPSLL